MGRQFIVLLLLFGIAAAACTSRTFGPASSGSTEATTTTSADTTTSTDTTTSAGTTGRDGADVTLATAIDEASSRLAVVSAGATATGEQSASGNDISVAGSSVSVVANVSGSSSVAVTSSATSSGDSSVVNVSITTGAGSFNRTVRFNGAGRFVLRVTADGDGLPVIQVEEVGP